MTAASCDVLQQFRTRLNLVLILVVFPTTGNFSTSKQRKMPWSKDVKSRYLAHGHPANTRFPMISLAVRLPIGALLERFSHLHPYGGLVLPLCLMGWDPPNSLGSQPLLWFGKNRKWGSHPVSIVWALWGSRVAPSNKGVKPLVFPKKSKNPLERLATSTRTIRLIK